MLLAVLTCALAAVGEARDWSWFGAQAQKAVDLCAGAGQREAVVQILHAMALEADRQQHAPKKSYVQWKTGHCEFLLGDYTQAQKTLKNTIDNAPEGFYYLHLVYRDLGEVAQLYGRVEQAATCFQKVLELDRAGKSGALKLDRLAEPEFIRIQLMSAGCYIGTGKFKQAAQAFAALEARIDKALTDHEEPAGRWQLLRAQCQMGLSVLDVHDRRLLRGLQRIEESRDRMSALNTRYAAFFRLACCITLANRYWELGRFAEADRQLGLAEELLHADPVERSLAALKSTRAGLEIEKVTFALQEDPARPNLMAALAHAEKDLHDAIVHHDKVDRGQDSFIAAVNFHLAQVHDLRGRWFVTRGLAKEAVREFAQGKSRCDTALQLLDSLLPPTNDFVLEVHAKRAALSLALGDLTSARQEALATYELFAKEHGQEDMDCGRYFYLLLEVEARAGNLQRAAEYAEAQRRLVTRGLVHYLAGLTAPEQLQFFRKWDDPGLHAALRLGIQHAATDRSFAERSAEWLLNGKAKIAEVLAHLNTRERTGADYQEFQQCVQRQAYLLYGQPGDPVRVQQELLLEEAKKRDLAARWPITVPERWYTVKELRTQLDKDEVYVGIFCLRPDNTTARRYYAWVVPAAGPVRIAELGSADKIEKLVKEFVHHQENFIVIRQDGEKKAENDLRQDCLAPLSRLLLEPVLKVAGAKKRWIVSPDGPLWNVPWASLLLPQGDKFAIEEMSFRYVISGRELIEQAGRKVATAEPLIMGDPDLDFAPKGSPGRLRAPGDPLLIPLRLPASAEECKMIGGILRESLKMQPHEVLGSTMTKDQLSGLTRAPRFVYLSTHSLFSLPTKLQVDDPLLRCAIAFAGWNHLPDGNDGKAAALAGVMTGAEVLAVDLRGTELVVLASCQSGTGVLQYGQSPADLRHAFHLAGARAVVSSLWGVDDKSTKKLMVSFMDSLCRQSASDKTAALRDAQLQMIRGLREHRKHAHPFYWAAFTLSGS